ncbi:2TM domain-containing protein [Thermopetrobacter sp. TC1]|uniref:2TM domain-containing protein n=1 Tax=Thermopetrobacter sp. TC1 TaxID=1495045 RepID=UPI000570791A|nr:2TM domain-containing protein [Thermopetrobacter sp. TC1]
MNIIRALRLEKGWSQEDLAAASGISVRTIQRLENGGRASLETLKCLAAVFESELSELRENMQMNTTAGNVMPGSCLSEEDRAALNFANQLRRYAELEDGRDPQEENIRRQVRSERAFLIHIAFFIIANALLLGINLITTPQKIWAIWPLLGWGLGLFLHGLRAYSRHSRFLGEEWERRRVEERLKRLAEQKRTE